MKYKQVKVINYPFKFEMLGVTYREASKATGIQLSQLWKVINGKIVVSEKLAKNILDKLEKIKK